ncbi:four helix bundle protein [Longibacter salinarum]|uniref:Four helix bundle protein n=1 Tax=Longibacter salinarum TaxID=1850348 RepID=A0A2A8CW09_9BACT|nr:four helix bundle protein [Longibacter salinarum]PEN12895.1 four helix bundle protein [Longibacter salinarum]
MVRDFKDLRVYEQAFACASEIFRLSTDWPPSERYSMTDQIRRASRSVCANIGEAWFKRDYPKHFSSKLSDALSEASETIVWLDLAAEHGYVSNEVDNFESRYRSIIGGLVKMKVNADKWCHTQNDDK